MLRLRPIVCVKADRAVARIVPDGGGGPHIIGRALAIHG